MKAFHRILLGGIVVCAFALPAVGCTNPAGGESDNGPTEDAEDGGDDGSAVLLGELSYLSELRDTDETALRGLYSVIYGKRSGTGLAFASGYSDNGITSLAIGADGTISAVDTVFDTDDTAFHEPGYLDTIMIGDSEYLLIPDYWDDGLNVLEVSSDGSLTQTEAIFDDDTTNLIDAWAVAAVTIGSENYAVVGGFDTDGLAVFSISESGLLSYVAGVPDSSDLALGEIWQITIFDAHDTLFVAPASGADGAISLFTLGSDGMLTEADTFLNTTETYVAETYALRHARVGGNEFLISFSSGADGGVSVFSIDPDGELAPVFNLGDGDAMGLSYITDSRVIQRADTAYLVTLSYEEGLTIFELGSDGTLHLKDWLDADAGTALQYAWSLDLREEADGTVLALVGGLNDQVGLVRIE